VKVKGKRVNGNEVVLRKTSQVTRYVMISSRLTACLGGATNVASRQTVISLGIK
jgi:hypothetical protein